jgi:hypothetical protein
VDHRFDSWPAMVIAPATGWVGELPARPLLNGGIDNLVINMTDESGAQIKAPPFTVPKLKDGADAFLYLGPRDSLTAISMTRTQLEGTPYLKELERRSKIQMAPLDPFPKKEEAPQYPRPQPDDSATPPVPPPPLPVPSPAKAPAPSLGPAAVRAKAKRAPVPLPPRPPSR